MIILFSTNTNEGGARICVEHWIRLLHDVADLYFLSGKGHEDIGVSPDMLKYYSFSNDWATSHNLKICDNIRQLPSDTILLEINNAGLWRNEKSMRCLSRFKHRATFNNIAWIDGLLHPYHSRFIKNYIAYYIPDAMRILLDELYHFTNLNEVIQYVDYGFMHNAGPFMEDRKIDLLTSFRKGSSKISKLLMNRLMEIAGNAQLLLRINDFGFHNHSQYLSWIKSGVRGYLHYQDQWVETFGYALYEGIKLCDFVIYKPEPYCDQMIKRLPEEDRRKVVRVKNEAELSAALVDKAFLRFPRTTEITKDVYMDRNYVQSKMLSILKNLHGD